MTRRRRVLGAIPALWGVTMAGCSQSPGQDCHSDSRPGVGFVVDPQTMSHEDGTWAVTCDVTVSMESATPETGIYGAALAAFGLGRSLVARTPLGDLTYESVPAADRATRDGCNGPVHYGDLSQRATVESDQFPRWLGLRYERTEGDVYYVGAEVATYEGEILPPDEPNAEAYQTVRVERPESRHGVVPPFAETPTGTET